MGEETIDFRMEKKELHRLRARNDDVTASRMNKVRLRMEEVFTEL